MLAPGSMVHDRYRIESVLGRGGMGCVYRATDITLQRPVALKVIAEEHLADPEMRARFIREARAAASIVHPNVAIIYDVLGETELAPAVIVMELVEGRSLRQALDGSSAPSLSQRLRWIQGLARGLDALHRGGYVHRDVKPNNVILRSSNDEPKLLDLGIARPTGAGSNMNETISFQTETGMALGTPRYMAPEQALGLAVDPSADQFAWGIVAYEVLAGAHPATLDPNFSVNAGWVGKPPPLSGNAPAELAPEVERIVMRALSRSANDRFANMADVVAALSAPPTAAPAATAKPRRVFLVSMIAVMAVGLAVLATWVKVRRPRAVQTSTPLSTSAPSPVETETLPAPAASIDVAAAASASASAAPSATSKPQHVARALKLTVYAPTDLHGPDLAAWKQSIAKDLLPCFQLPLRECWNAKYVIHFTFNDGAAEHVITTALLPDGHHCPANPAVLACSDAAVSKRKQVVPTRYLEDGRVEHYVAYGTIDVTLTF